MHDPVLDDGPEGKDRGQHSQHGPWSVPSEESRQDRHGGLDDPVGQAYFLMGHAGLVGQDLVQVQAMRTQQGLPAPHPHLGPWPGLQRTREGQYLRAASHQFSAQPPADKPRSPGDQSTGHESPGRFSGVNKLGAHDVSPCPEPRNAPSARRPPRPGGCAGPGSPGGRHCVRPGQASTHR